MTFRFSQPGSVLWVVLLQVLPAPTHTPEASWQVTWPTRLAGTGFLVWWSRGSVPKEWKWKAASSLKGEAPELS